MPERSSSYRRMLIIITGLYAVLWTICLLDWKWFTQLPELIPEEYSPESIANGVYAVVLAASVPLAIAWLAWSYRRGRIVQLAVLSASYVPSWQLILFLAELAGAEVFRAYTMRIGTGGLFLIGLMWVVRYVERTSKRYERARRENAAEASSPARIWNPLDPDAFYYGRRQKRLNQSLSAFLSYSFVFIMAFLVLTQIGGCSSEFELPAGGGELAQNTPQIKIQKIKRIKYVLNPLSAIIWQVPPIEEVKLEINKLTKHAYKVGQGKGEGAGFSSGTGKGKIQFIRLEYEGGDWNHGMGVGGDMNMLYEYGKRNSHKIAAKTGSIRTATLLKKNPAFIYITGQRGLTTSKRDDRILREYLHEKHGMIFASAGSAQFHSRFMALMSRLLPKVQAVAVPLDDPIHQLPQPVSRFPYVAPHGGRQALGWKVNGRWVAYYHPGDIGDAWCDDHAGIPSHVWEDCYRLGCNVKPEQIDRLSDFPLEQRKKIREVEKYQWNIAMNYYRPTKRSVKPDYKVAASEFEKFLTLYERSVAAPYAQLLWSNCQVRLKKHNTAVKDGYQSVIDYWPNSPAAIASAFLIGHTRKQTGDIPAAKRALKNVIEKYPKHLVAAFALADLVDIATIEKDADARVNHWKVLTFDIPRDKTHRLRGSVRNRLCAAAAQKLAAHYFAEVAFDDGVKALATTYPEKELPDSVYSYTHAPIATLTADEKTKLKGEKLADLAISYIREKIPAGTSDEMVKQQALKLWYYIAELHSQARRDAKVVETFNRIGKVYGFDDAVLGKLADWQRRRAQYDQARATYARFKNKIEGHNQIALTHWYQRKYLLAATSYRQALALDPDNAVLWKQRIASALREGKKPNEAIAVYNELITEDTKDPQGWRYQIGWTYQRYAGNPKQAIAVYRQCGDKFPNNYWRMAECHRALKQYKEAITLYNQIAGGAPNLAPQANWDKSETYRAWQKKDLEIKTLRLICKRYPRNSYASKAHARLQRDYKINVTLGGAKDE
eukprot:g21960.t1